MGEQQARSTWGGRYESIRAARFTHEETVALLEAEDAQARPAVWGRSGSGPLVHHLLTGRIGHKHTSACGKSYLIRWAYPEAQAIKLRAPLCAKCEAARGR